jgi:hypothetical protein
MFNYQEKYLKYKNKYLKLKDLIGGENKFKCNKENRKIGYLCDLDETGTFITKDECEIKCLEEKLNEEFCAWRKLFEWSSKKFKDIHIYCKGGSALGLLVLKTILDKDRNKYTDFIDLKLIKDWDFTVNMSLEQQAQFIIKAQELGIVNQGQDLVILRFKKGLQLVEDCLSDGDYLLELSIKTTQELYDLELPLTNLKFEVNSDNIELFFEIVKMYVKKKVDLDIMSSNLNTLLTTIVVNGIEQVDSIENGLYTITDPKKISTANLNSKLLEIMDSVPYVSGDSINQLTMKQFLITQLCQPDRLFLRFLGKNVIKSQNITRFFQANGIALPEWLINASILDEINRKIIIFLINLNQFIESQITYSESKSRELLKPFINLMNNLFENVNLARIKSTTSNIKLLKYLVPWNFFQQVKKESICNIKLTCEAYLASEKGQKLTEKQIAAKRTINYKYTDSMTPNDTKYGQFLGYIINRLE